MPTATLFRLSGAVLMLGAIIGAIVVAIHPHELTDPIDGPVHLALFCGDLLVLLALPAVLARQAGRISILGSIGYVLVFIGLAFDDITHSVLEFSVVPVLASDPTTRPMLAPDSATSVALIHGPFGLMLAFGLPLIAMGLLAFNAATLRAGVLSRWPALIHLASALLLLVMMVFPPVGPVGPALFYVGLGAYGVVLMGPKTAEVDANLSVVVAPGPVRS